MYTCHSERIIFQCVKDTAIEKTERNSLIRKKIESTVKSTEEELFNWQKTAQPWFMSVLCREWKYFTDRNHHNYSRKSNHEQKDLSETQQ